MDSRRRTLNDNSSLGRFGQLSLQTCLFQIGKHHQNIQKPQEIRLGK
jgi:hypothetical protein